MDEKTLNAISDATLEVIGDQLYKPPVLTPALTPDDIGKDIKGEGIYLGTYAPVDRDGVSLKKVFNVFAAPDDLFIKETRQVHKKAKGLRGLFGATVVENETKYIEIFTYEDAVKYVAGLKSWHGHDGANHATDKELYTAIKDSTYNGGWIIPTRDILLGKDLNDNKTTPDNILAHKDKGSLKGTFKMAASGGSDCPDSCPQNWGQ